MVTRTQVAQVVADRLEHDRDGAIRQAAAWLVAQGRDRQAAYLARDVARILGHNGYVTARITTARPLAETARREIEEFIKAQTGASSVEITTAVDPTLIGGVRIETPEAELDASVRTKLARMIEGAK